MRRLLVRLCDDEVGGGGERRQRQREEGDDGVGGALARLALGQLDQRVARAGVFLFVFVARSPHPPSARSARRRCCLLYLYLLFFSVLALARLALCQLDQRVARAVIFFFFNCAVGAANLPCLSSSERLAANQELPGAKGEGKGGEGGLPSSCFSTAPLVPQNVHGDAGRGGNKKMRGPGGRGAPLHELSARPHPLRVAVAGGGSSRRSAGVRRRFAPLATPRR